MWKLVASGAIGPKKGGRNGGMRRNVPVRPMDCQEVEMLA